MKSKDKPALITSGNPFNPATQPRVSQWIQRVFLSPKVRKFGSYIHCFHTMKDFGSPDTKSGKNYWNMLF